MIKFLKEMFRRYNNVSTSGIGIDLGLKEYATCSDGRTYHHFNKMPYIKNLEKQLQYMSGSKKEQAMKDIYAYRIGCIERIVDDIVSTNPKYITIEDLHFSGTGALQKALDDSLFPHFKYYLSLKCKANGIQLRMVKKNYPSSKLCSRCGAYKKDLKLSDRTYICSTCGMVMDRDYNASYNLMKATDYYIIA